MASLNEDSNLIGKDLRYGDDDQRPGPSQPVSQTEIEELLFNESLPASDRVARLKQYRDELTTQESLDFGDNDPGSVISEIDLAIARLEDGGYTGTVEALSDIDPIDHRETLSPDDDALEALEEDDEAGETDLFGDEGLDDDGFEELDEDDENDSVNSRRDIH